MMNIKGEALNVGEEVAVIEYEEHGRVVASGESTLWVVLDYLMNHEGLDLTDESNYEWRPVLGYEGLYEVCNLGVVKSLRRGKVMNPQLKYSMGADTKAMWRMNVVLTKDGVAVAHKIHKLVFEAFVGKVPDDMVISHGNDRPIDNRLTNLSLATYKENANTRYALDDVLCGRLTAETIPAIVAELSRVAEDVVGREGYVVDGLSDYDVEELKEYTGVSEGTLRELQRYIWDGDGLYSLLDLDDSGVCYIK